MKHAGGWESTKADFRSWWKREKKGKPLMWVVAAKEMHAADLETERAFISPQEQYLDVDEIVKRYRNYCRSHVFLADAFPNLDLNIGAGSMALYLGSEPDFQWDTVWFKPCVAGSWDQFDDFRFDQNNNWWEKHLKMIKRAQDLSSGEFLVNIPDIVENIDILAALRGPQELCFDLADNPESIADRIRQLDDLYFKYYDPMYNLVKDQDGSSSFTAFLVWGAGKTAKIQCDFSALISPKQFRDLVMPSLRKQCRILDNIIYHLDGPDAIKHADALLEIEELDAVQWVPGAGRPDGGDEMWYPLYDKVRNANKSLWIYLEDGGISSWIRHADRLVGRYGTNALYLVFPCMSESEADILLETAEKRWH
jgi:hypothetical protein